MALGALGEAKETQGLKAGSLSHFEGFPNT